jgi:SAM-dependent methyltransferase
MTDGSLWTVTGDPLTPELARRLLGQGPFRLWGVDPAIAPIEQSDVVKIDAPRSLGAGDLVLGHWDGACHLARLVKPAPAGWMVRRDSEPSSRFLPNDTILGVAEHVEKGDLIVDLTRGRWRGLGRLLIHLPPRLCRYAGVLGALERLRRPFFPPLSLGSEDYMLHQLRITYDREAPYFARSEGLNEEEETLLARFLKPGMRLLDIGCGAGREALAFGRAGIEVVGIDLSPTMVELARENAKAAGLSITFEAGDPSAISFPPESFDVIYVSPGVYAHIPGRARRIETLRAFRLLLLPEGLLAFAPLFFFTRRLLSRGRLVDTIRRVGRWCGIQHLSEPGDRYYLGQALVSSSDSFRYAHYFANAAEVEAELEAGGFALAERIGDGEGALWIARSSVSSARCHTP